MKATVIDFEKDKIMYNFSEVSREELENKLTLFFSSEGYTLKSHEGESYSYTKGNRVMRLLFGAFVKYHKQTLIVKEQGSVFLVLLQRESTGISGGLIGMNQVRKEFGRLAEAFRTYFAN